MNSAHILSVVFVCVLFWLLQRSGRTKTLHSEPTASQTRSRCAYCGKEASTSYRREAIVAGDRTLGVPDSTVTVQLPLCHHHSVSREWPTSWKDVASAILGTVLMFNFFTVGAILMLGLGQWADLVFLGATLLGLAYGILWSVPPKFAANRWAKALRVIGPMAEKLLNEAVGREKGRVALEIQRRRLQRDIQQREEQQRREVQQREEQKRREELERERLGRLSTVEGLHSLGGHQFEKLIAELFAKMGYHTVRTPLSGDGGIDVLAKKSGQTVVIQCKNFSGPVGPSMIRDLYGTMIHEKADKGILVCTSTFTAGARDFAGGKPITLIGVDELIRLIKEHIGHRLESERITLPSADRS